MDNNAIMDKIWDCAEDLIGYANELEKHGRKESEEGLRTIISQLENLCDYMYEHPK